jgi:hypothetical protein
VLTCEREMGTRRGEDDERLFLHGLFYLCFINICTSLNIHERISEQRDEKELNDECMSASDIHSNILPYVERNVLWTFRNGRDELNHRKTNNNNERQKIC